ncbi:50S ribosome-binding GTPase [Arthrobacter ginkgonis]|uniref:50S ribosome-binding GTPase n=1 Tax=Arthrobacter ginkgonis TaxID=1630594 RepID=A0ABP7BX09_9MICC
MSRRRRDTEATPLITRLEALNEARQLGEGRVPEAAAADAYAVLERASKRRSLSAEHTVVGFFGATGSGKSSLFNAVAGQQLARAAATRPTTSAPLAAVWGEEGSGPLLDWLQVEERRQLEDPLPAPKGGLFRKAPAQGGLILLDLPDFDSTAAEHRETVRRLAGQVDVLVWVLDPQKYADAAVHHDFIRPMAGHGAITLVVLNQIDRLRPGQLDPVVVSLRGLLARDGLPGIDVLPVSAATGEGVGKLREAVGAVTAERTAATERLLADVGAAADTLAGALAADAVPAATGPIAVLGAGWGEAGREDAAPNRAAPAPHQLELPGKEAVRRLSENLAEASGVGIVVQAVRDSYRKDAHARTGWPVVRWLGKLRPDPLRRLNLDSKDLVGRSVNPALNRTALPPAGAAQRAQADSAVRTFADAAAGGAPDVWRASIRRAARGSADTLPDALDQAIAGTDIGAGRGSWWWPVAGIVQWIALAVALAGAAWLGGLAVMGFLQFPVPPVPVVEGIPVPTLMLVTGVLLGIVLGLASGVAARAAAAARARTVSRRLHAAVAGVAATRVVAPVADEVSRYNRFAEALAVARG